MKLDLSKEKCLALAEQEGDTLPGAAVPPCPHMNFAATVNVGRHLDNETETHVVGYSAEVHIKCAECGKPFQFLGLPMGVDTHGARVSVDGLEARLAISPQGVQPSPINRMQFNISKHDS